MAPRTPIVLRLGPRGGLTQKTSVTSLSVSHNGRFAVTGDEQGSIRVFDLTSETEVGTARTDRKATRSHRKLEKVAVSDDGKHIAACDRELSLYLGTTDAEGDLLCTSRQFISRTVAFLPGSTRVAVIGGSLRFYEGNVQVAQDTEETVEAQDLAVAPDGRVAVVFRGETNRAHLFDANGKSLARVTIDAECVSARIGFITNERLLIATRDGALFFWNGKDDQTERRHTALTWGSFSRPWLLAPAGHLVSNNNDPLFSNHEPSRIFPLDGTPPRAIGVRDAWACSPDGAVLLSANGGRLERLGADLLLPLSHTALNGWVRGVAFAPEARSVWTVDDAAACRWSLPDATLKEDIALPADHRPRGLSGDGGVVLLEESRNETQRLFELQTGKWLCAPIDTHSRVSGLSTDGRWFASGAHAKNGEPDGVEVLDVATGKVTTRLVASEPWVPYNAVPSADGRFVVCVNNRYRIVTFDARSGRELGSFDGPRGVVMSLCVSASGERFWFGLDNANVVASHAPGGRVFPSLTGLRRNDVHTLALSPDEKWLAGSDGNSTAVWNLASGKRVLTLQEGAWSLAFSADSKQLALGGNGTACVVAIP